MQKWLVFKIELSLFTCKRTVKTSIQWAVFCSVCFLYKSTHLHHDTTKLYWFTSIDGFQCKQKWKFVLEKWIANFAITWAGPSKIDEVKINLSLTQMKPHEAIWLTRLYNYMQTKPDIVRNGFNIVNIGIGLNCDRKFELLQIETKLVNLFA